MKKIILFTSAVLSTMVFADDISITQGRAITDIDNLYACGNSYRKSGVGHVVDSMNHKWIVPAPVIFPQARKAHDLYNKCSKTVPASIDQVDVSSIPIVEVDPDGEVITGYIFADNYFELYVNGVLVGVDPVPFTQFNSNVVRFRVKPPVTYAIRLVDWEENLGLGSEDNRGNAFHAGDGGFVASFSDGTVTDSSWRAQTFYTAPIDSPSNIKTVGSVRDSSMVDIDKLSCGENCFAAHWPLSSDWFNENFDDSSWPSASEFTNDVIGVKNKPAYMNFSELFIGKNAKFIWSSNVVLDNHVIIRKTTK